MTTPPRTTTTTVTTTVAMATATITNRVVRVVRVVRDEEQSKELNSHVAWTTVP